MQNLIKDSEKSLKMSNLNNFPSTSTQIPNFNSFNPFPALTNLQALHQLSTRSPPAPPLAAQIPYKSPTTTANNLNDSQSGTTPLDLSSSSTPPLAKRMKLSPTSSETVVTQQQRQQQATSPPNVTTTNNQLSSSATTTGGFSATSSSSSTTSNGSEQASAGNAQSARKCQLKVDEINAWNVDEVCSFVEGIAICAEYVKVSRFVSISYLLIYFTFQNRVQQCPPSPNPTHSFFIQYSRIFSFRFVSVRHNEFQLNTIAIIVIIQ